MSKRVYVPDGLFSEKEACRIEDDGSVKIASGCFSEKEVAFIHGDGRVTVPTGAFSEREVLRIDGDGRVISPEGFFGKEVARVREDGSVYVSEGLSERKVARIDGYRRGVQSDASPSDMPGKGASGNTVEDFAPVTPTGLGFDATELVVALVVIAFIVIMWAAVIPNTLRAGGETSRNLQIMLLVISVAMAVSLFVAHRFSEKNIHKMGYADMLATCMIGGNIPLPVIGLISVIAEADAGLGDWLTALLLVPFMSFLLSVVPALLMALLVFLFTRQETD